jgi:tetratricopeptide (TPR) repeat protein
MSESLSLLSNLAFEQKKMVDAKRLAEQALALSEEMGDVPGITRGLCNLGEICTKTDDFDRAAEVYSRAIELARKAGDEYHVACALAGTARCKAKSGDDRAAVILMRRARRIFWRKRAVSDLREVIDDLAVVHRRLGEPDRERAHLAVNNKLKGDATDDNGRHSPRIERAARALVPTVGGKGSQ